jgi:hypothetical protein
LFSGVVSVCALISGSGIVFAGASSSFIVVSAAAVESCFAMAANRLVGGSRNGISHVSVSLDWGSGECGFFLDVGRALSR